MNPAHCTRRPARTALLLTALLAASPGAAAAQTAAAPLADSVQAARLAGLGQVWGMVKFFHPYLAYRHVDWDGALVQAIPHVMAARSAADYQGAVNGMLAALGDPSTRAELSTVRGDGRGASGTPPDSLPVRVQDGALMIDVVSLARIAAWDNEAVGSHLARIAPALATAQAVALDLRGAELLAEEDADAVSYELTDHLAGVIVQLLDSTVVLGSVRSRVHSGFAPQAGGTSGSYYSSFGTTEPRVLPGRNGNRTPPIAVLVNSRTPMVAEFLAGLRSSGRAIVVQDGASAAEVGVLVYAITLPDGVRVWMRTGEIVAPDGTVGFAADTVIVGGDGELWRSALAMARGPRRPMRPGRAGAVALAAQRDSAYAEMQFPSFEYRLVALFRYWNTIEHFFPYKHLMDSAWAGVLPRYIPRFAANRDAADYQQTVRELTAEIQDSHSTLRGATQLRDRRGQGSPPFAARFVEGQTIITHVLEPLPDIHPGDVILAIDGESIQSYRDRITPITPASTPQALQRDVHYGIGRGALGSPMRLTLRGLDGVVREAQTARSVRGDDPRWDATEPTRRSTPVFGVLPSGFGYVDLQRLQGAQVDSMFRAVGRTPAVIFDMRGYPNGTAWTIAPRLTTRQTPPAALFSRPHLDARALGYPDLAGTASFTYVQRLPAPLGAPYLGRVVMLIDENSQSQAEHTALFFEAATDVTFVGTPTAGANGDITTVVLPGNLVAGFSGHDIRHADGRQLQRVGIQPHVLVAPTIRGLVEGRDEVLEAAVRHLQATPR